MAQPKTNSTVMEHFFCSAKIRPSCCLKKNSICCLHCEKTVECKTLPHKGTKPCDFSNMSYDDICEFSI